MISLESLVAKLKLVFNRSEFTEADKLMSGLKKTAAVVGAAWAAVKIGDTVSGWVAETDKASQAAENMAATFNISTKQAQVWGYSAGAVGANNEALAGTLRALSRVMQSARTNGMDPAVISLRKLGVTADVIKRQDLGKALEQVGEGLAGGKLKGKGEMAHIMAALGDESTKLLPWLRGGAKGMADLAQEAENFGAVIEDSAIEDMRTLRGETRRLDSVFGALKREVALALVPTLISASQKGVELARRFSGPIAAAIRTAAAVIRPLVTILRESLASAFSFVAEKAREVWDWITNAVDAIRNSAAAAKIGGVVWIALKAAFQVVVSTLKILWQTLRFVFNAIVAGAKVVWGIVEAVISLTDRLGILGVVIGVVKVGLHIVVEIFEGLRHIVEQLADGLAVMGDFGIEAARAIGEAMHEALDWIVDTLHDVLDTFGLIRGTDQEEAAISRFNQLKAADAASGRHQGDSALWAQAQREAADGAAGAIAQPTVNAGDPWSAIRAPAPDIGPWGAGWTGGGTTSVEINVNSTAPAPEVAEEVRKKFREELARAQARAR